MKWPIQLFSKQLKQVDLTDWKEAHEVRLTDSEQLYKINYALTFFYFVNWSYTETASFDAQLRETYIYP